MTGGWNMQIGPGRGSVAHDPGSFAGERETADRHFNRLEMVERVDPADLAELAQAG